MLLGCIADDFTGASDLANTLAKSGFRTTQFISSNTGTPSASDTPSPFPWSPNHGPQPCTLM